VYGTPYWLIHRPDYHHLLHQAALENGCEIRVKSRVKSVDESVPSITLSSGETLNADIIIGADGISYSEWTNIRHKIYRSISSRRHKCPTKIIRRMRLSSNSRSRRSPLRTRITTLYRTASRKLLDRARKTSHGLSNST
jgi:hypothetical protein